MIDRRKIAGLSLSAVALVGIAGWETYRGDAYYATEHEKAKGISTIGWGDTQGVKPTDRTTPDKALVRLLAQTNAFEQGMRACIGDDVLMTQAAWDAMVSLTFNVGLGKEGVADGFCYLKRGGNSTIVRRLKAGDLAGACEGLKAWNKQNGVELPGLTRRREAEYRTCTGG